MSEIKDKPTLSGNKLSPEQYNAVAEAVFKCLSGMPSSEQYKSLVETVILVHEEQKAKDLKEEADKRTDIVRLMLKNYRKFKLYAKNAVSDIKKANRILEETLCDVNSLKDELKVESIIRTRERTLVMIAHIDKMMKIYKHICEDSDDPADIRRWNVLYDMYINPTVKLSANNICEKYYIDRSTVFADISMACEDMGPLFFGVLGVEI